MPSVFQNFLNQLMDIRARAFGTPMSERQGYMQYDARQSKPTWTTLEAPPGVQKEWGLGPNGEPIGRPTIKAGENANTSAVKGLEPLENLTSADIRNYRKLYAKPVIAEPGPYQGIDEPMDLVTDESLNRDDDVQQTGWLPADFQNMSPQAAAALIADQLRTRRIRFMQEAAPDFLQTLPQY